MREASVAICHSLAGAHDPPWNERRWRAVLRKIGESAGAQVLFGDGFEFGTTSGWRFVFP